MPTGSVVSPSDAAPQHSGVESERIAHTNPLPALIAMTVPGGVGYAAMSAPQHTGSPLVLMAQLCAPPAVTAETVPRPGGTVACWKVLSPQHRAAPSAAIAHECAAPASSEPPTRPAPLNGPDGELAAPD